MFALRSIAVTTSLAALVLGAAACSSQSPSSAPKPPVSGAGSPSATSPGNAHQTQPAANPPATEYRPPGDIPDSQVYVPFRVPGTKVSLKVPEGWARQSTGGTTMFSDHYNSIAISVQQAASAPSVSRAKQTTVPQLRSSVSKFAPGQVSKVQLQGGSAILVTYLKDSAPNAVTGKVVRDAVERFEFWRHGQEAVLTLTGPKTADNVDPWHLVSNSLQWR